jgi:hypothetical protein
MLSIAAKVVGPENIAVVKEISQKAQQAKLKAKNESKIKAFVHACQVLFRFITMATLDVQAVSIK